jgi:hypothetical protein
MKDKKDPFDHPFFTDTDNYIKKQRIKYIIISLVFAVGMWFLIGKLFDEGEKQTQVTKSFIGKKVVIEKDTMTVIDYSTFSKTYKLSNGIDYDMDFVKSKIIK